MKRLLIFPLIAISLFAQSGYVSVIKQIPPTAWQLGAGSTIQTLPDDTLALQVAYKSAASVDLGVSPAQLQADPAHPGNAGYAIDGIYQLTFSAQNSDGPYPGLFDIEITFGTQKLCEVYGWGTSTFAKVGVTCPSPKYLVADQALDPGGPVQSQHNLIIAVSNPEWPILLKDVSLTFTPTN